MRKFRYVHIPIYCIDLYMIQCSKKQFISKCKDKFKIIPDFSDNSDGYFMVVENAKGFLNYIIWIENWKIFTHELLHCVTRIMDDCGLKLTLESDEAYAYLIGYLDNKLRKHK